MGLLLLSFAPKIFKKKAIDAREQVVSKFVEYYEAHGLEGGSPLARGRHDVPASYGLTTDEIARLEVPFDFAVLNNTLGAAFWILSHIYSQPSTLVEIREELTQVIQVNNRIGTGQPAFVINLADIRQRCPILLAAFHEILRVYSVRPNFRQVVEDTLLDGRYFLEKGTIVHLLTKTIHEDPQTWGPNAKTINLRRFLDSPHGGNLSKSTTAFGTFGAAPHICPGRHFATMEIMAITSQLIIRYNMQPVSTQGWQVPKQNLNGFNSVTGPIRDMQVEFVPRKDWQGDWSYVLGDWNLKFAFASG
jgi:cytochrome P450